MYERILHQGKYAVWCDNCKTYHEDTTPHLDEATPHVEGCTGKVRHQKAYQAISAAQNHREKQLFPYPCQHCGGWHLSKQRVNDYQVKQIKRLAKGK